MLQTVDKIVSDIQNGTLSPEKAVEAFDLPSTHIADIGFDFDTSILPTGFPSMDELMLLRSGKPDLVILAGRPGCGKTAFVCQIALNVSKYGNVLGYSLEMSKKQLSSRLASVEAELPSKALHLPSNKRRLDEVIARFKSYKLRIDDTGSIDIDTIFARTLDYHKKAPIDLVFVDYLQIVPTKISRSRAEEVAYISEKLKELAKTINAPVIAVTQMNRAFDTRLASDKAARPVMSDLADSAGIERWADMIVCLHKDQSNTQAFVLKNRHGEVRDFNLNFIGAQSRFIDEGISI